MSEATRKQIAAQCRVVEHLATVLAKVHADYAQLFEAGPSGADEIGDIVGSRTASFMETLGDMLNGMDAVESEDDWVNPVFAEAQRRWPVEPPDSAPPAERR